MKKINAFMEGGSFYKGNLHGHSVISDGKLTVYELKDAYRKKGYNFFAFTDHNIYGNHEYLNEDGFIAIQGVERHIKTGSDIREFHFVAIPDPSVKNPRYYDHLEEIPVYGFEKGFETAQILINELRERGYLVTFCHPHWSTVEYDDVLKLDGLFAVEVYNNSADVIDEMGNSNVLWDAILRRGKKIWGTAVDDNHNKYLMNTQYNDSFGGWVMVKANSLCEADICGALASGSFYSSQGPEIHDLYIENGHVYVECSPVNRIYINGGLRNNKEIIAPGAEDSLTSCCVSLMKSPLYIRVECIDSMGRRAISNPIFLNDIE